MDLFGGAPPATKSKFGGALQANNNEIAGHGPPLGHGPTPCLNLFSQRMPLMFLKYIIFLYFMDHSS